MTTRHKHLGLALLASLLLVMALSATAALAAGGYTLDWWSADGGGGSSTGGSYALSGTVGQPDAGALGGGSYALDGGYWAAGATNRPPRTLGVSPRYSYSEPGDPLLMEAAYSDPDGWDDLATVYFRLAPSASLTNCVYLRYDVQAELLWLRRPDDGAWKGGVAPGTPGTIHNNYVYLDYGLTSVDVAGEVLTVTWAFSPTYRLSGQEHHLYLQAMDLDWLVDGWDDYGEWIINRAPTLIPPDLHNETVPSLERMTFNARYKDLDGKEDLGVMYYALASDLPTHEMEANGVFLKYDPATNLMYLADTLGTTWGTGLTPGTDQPLSNDAVTVIVRWSSIGSGGAKIVIVNWRLEFATAFEGFHKVFMRTSDPFPAANGDTGWKYKGTLTIAP